MNAGEFIALCKPLGYGWQTKLAKHLGVSDRTIRRKVSSESPITKAEEAEIRRYVKRKLLSARRKPAPQIMEDS